MKLLAPLPNPFLVGLKHDTFLLNDVETSVTRRLIYWTLGNFSKSLTAINLPKLIDIRRQFL